MTKKTASEMLDRSNCNELSAHHRMPYLYSEKGREQRRPHKPHSNGWFLFTLSVSVCSMPVFVAIAFSRIYNTYIRSQHSNANEMKNPEENILTSSTCQNDFIISMQMYVSSIMDYGWFRRPPHSIIRYLATHGEHRTSSQKHVRPPKVINSGTGQPIVLIFERHTQTCTHLNIGCHCHCHCQRCCATWIECNAE